MIYIVLGEKKEVLNVLLKVAGETPNLSAKTSFKTPFLSFIRVKKKIIL